MLSVYANSFLATLNARHSIRQGLSVGNSSSEGINSIRVENLRFAHGTAVRSSREVRVLGTAGGDTAHGEGSATDVDIMEMESGSRGKDFKRKETVSVRALRLLKVRDDGTHCFVRQPLTV